MVVGVCEISGDLETSSISLSMVVGVCEISGDLETSSISLAMVFRIV